MVNNAFVCIFYTYEYIHSPHFTLHHHYICAGFGDESVVLGLLLVLLAELLGTGVFLLNIDTVGRRVLLMSGV